MVPLYEYSAIDAQGKRKKGIVSATSSQVAYEKLRGQGLYPLKVSPSHHEKDEKRYKKGGFRSPPTQELIYSMRQLSTLLSAGFSIDKALDATVEQIKNSYLKSCMIQICEDIREGKSFSSSLYSFPRLFSPAIRAMVMAAESSGTLDIVLEEVANLLEEQATFKRKIYSSIAYPLFVLLVGCVAVVFLLMFVVPRVMLIFSQMNQALPLPTIILIGLSNFIGKWWWMICVLAIVSVFVMKRAMGITSIKRRMDSLILKLPLVGRLLREIIVARFARILGTLLKNGVPLITALDIVGNISSNIRIKETIRDIKSCVGEGKEMVTPMQNSHLFPTPMIQMVAAGIESGSLDKLLIKISENMEKEISSRLSFLVSLIEPILILVLGIMVGYVVIAILLPILEMSQLVG